MESPRITRRRLTLSAVAAPALMAQAPAPSSPPPADVLAAAQKQVAQNAETLRKFRVPPQLEPAFVYRP